MQLLFCKCTRATYARARTSTAEEEKKFEDNDDGREVKTLRGDTLVTREQTPRRGSALRCRRRRRSNRVMKCVKEYAPSAQPDEDRIPGKDARGGKAAGRQAGYTAGERRN